MGGAVKKANQFMRSDLGWFIPPAKLGYETLGGRKTFDPLVGDRPDATSGLPSPPAPAPDITDKVIQMARERERRKQMGGGRQSTFLSGVLGDQSAPSTFVKQLMGS